MDNGWNRIGEDKTAKNECLRKERYVFVFEDGEKKKTMFRDGKYVYVRRYPCGHKKALFFTSGTSTYFVSKSYLTEPNVQPIN